jgi:transposase InsO family protein
MTPRHHDFLLNTSCRLTKFAIAIPCSQKIDKQQLAETLFNEVFWRYGIPLVIVSDRDPRLENAFFSQLASLQGTSQRLTTAHRPQGNGQAEALNKELMTKLKAYCYDPPHSADWDTFVAHLCSAYNRTVHSSHG